LTIAARKFKTFRRLITELCWLTITVSHHHR
jgi:hypothetical protein